MDPVTTGVCADEHQAVPGALGPRAHQPVDANQPDAHCVDQRVVRVALLEIDLTTDRWDANAVSVAADAGDDPFDVTGGAGLGAEAQRVEQRDRPGAHCDHVADDAAHARRSALIWLDGRGMVVRFDLEHGRPAVADVHGARIFTRTLDYGWTSRRQPSQQGLGALVRAVLRPEHSEHAELDLAWGPLQLFNDDPVFLWGERDFPQSSLVDPLTYGQEARTFIAFAAAERNSLSPSVPPSSASAQRSGCGIMPSTLPRALTIPAMLCSEPLGFALEVTRPSAEQYRKTTW